MHATYKEEDVHVLQHAGEEELACHCRLRPRGGATMRASSARAETTMTCFLLFGVLEHVLVLLFV